MAIDLVKAGEILVPIPADIETPDDVSKYAAALFRRYTGRADVRPHVTENHQCTLWDYGRQRVNGSFALLQFRWMPRTDPSHMRVRCKELSKVN